MLSDDVFRARLQTTIASLRYWVPQIADAACIEESEGPGYWKITITPKVRGACPFELMLRESQHFDLVLADETYEDRPIETLDLFLPLVEGIAGGRVVQRRFVSAMTGRERDVESVVDTGGGKQWRDRRVSAAAVDAEGIEQHDVHFLPYHRDQY